MWTVIARLIVLLVTLPVHEYAHARTAVRLGDDTPREQGRLTLNPFAHLDVFGSLAILLIGFGWAKPVMVDARNFSKPKRDMALTSVAGPLANVLMAFVFLIAYKIAYFTAANASYMGTLLQVLALIVRINLNLAVFNLLPVPPLDGSKLLAVFLPERIYYLFLRYERYVMLALIAMLWLGVLTGPIIFLSGKLLDLLLFLTGPVDMIFNLLA